jgi:hypothetical protein
MTKSSDQFVLPSLEEAQQQSVRIQAICEQADAGIALLDQIIAE